MRLLLDTHGFLWFISGNEQLPQVARKVIANMNNEVLLSVASLWEIAIKTGLGKLILVRPFEELIPEQLILMSETILVSTLSTCTLPKSGCQAFFSGKQWRLTTVTPP